MSGGRDWTRVEERQLVAWRADGLKLAACARRLGRSYTAVAQRLHKLGATVPCLAWQDGTPRRRNGYLMRAVRRLCRPGVGDEEVADRLGVSRQTVYQTRVRLGIPAGLSNSERVRLAAQTRRLRL